MGSFRTAAQCAYVGVSMAHFVTDSFNQAGVLIAIIVCIGQVSLRKHFAEALAGTIKAFIGVMLIGAGTKVVAASLDPLGAMFAVGFGVQAVVPNTEAIMALLLEAHGAQASLVMAIGFVLHVLIARCTPVKPIFMTSHHNTLYMATLMSAVLSAAGIGGAMLVALGSVATALTLSLSPCLSQWAVRYIVQDQRKSFAPMAIGHLSNITYAISALLGKVFGRGSRSTETLQLPKCLNFMRDNVLATAITMTVFYVAGALAAGKAYIEQELSGGMHFIVFAIVQASTFAVGVYIVLSGVRFIIAQVVPAFGRFAQVFAPRAVPALDCPVVFPFAPNAVIIGFLSSCVGGIVGLGVLSLASKILILPGILAHFFVGATAGVFGNATGGIRGCVLGAFANGLLITFLPLALLPFLGDFGAAHTVVSDGDYALFGALFGYAVQFLGL